MASADETAMHIVSKFLALGINGSQITLVGATR